LFDVSDGTPDDNADNGWSAAVADTRDPAGESGSGVLSRIAIASEAGAPAALHAIWLVDAGHIDHNNDSHVPLSLNAATVAVDQSCPPAEPSP
jgi:hypothetical protein